jgi:hypothetical protein
MEKESFAMDVAPDGAGKTFWFGFYKDAAPMALGYFQKSRWDSKRCGAAEKEELFCC